MRAKPATLTPALSRRERVLFFIVLVEP